MTPGSYLASLGVEPNRRLLSAAAIVLTTAPYGWLARTLEEKRACAVIREAISAQPQDVDGRRKVVR